MVLLIVGRQECYEGSEVIDSSAVRSFMTESFLLYVVDEDALPSELDALSDEEKYDVLVAAVESDGMLHSSIEMTVDDFVDAVETLDKHFGGEQFLPICAMNNSPYDVLGRNSECPFFGYFSPGDVQRTFSALDSLDEEILDTIESCETHSEVFHALHSATMEAVETGSAVAIVHG